MPSGLSRFYHWEKARQLYKVHNLPQKWAKTTLNLAENYMDLGFVKKSQQLLEELEKANYSNTDALLGHSLYAKRYP